MMDKLITTAFLAFALVCLYRHSILGVALSSATISWLIWLLIFYTFMNFIYLILAPYIKGIQK